METLNNKQQNKLMYPLTNQQTKSMYPELGDVQLEVVAGGQAPTGYCAAIFNICKQ